MAGGALAPIAQRSNVERKYDEKRELQTVVASFGIERNVSIMMAGAPGATLGEILVELKLPRYLARGECSSLEVLVNDVPTPGARFSTGYKDAVYSAQARHDFQTFKPLAQRYSTLAVRGCGYEAKLDEHAMGDVRKFFVIYSQIASEITASQQPAPAMTSTASDPATEL